MKIYDIIDKKKKGGELSLEEICHFISCVVSRDIDEAQIGAFLMAVYLQGMTGKETLFLTQAMVDSGEQYDLSAYDLTVDKHSSGGVGDSTTFVVMPILAALGCVSAKMSGRGLAYTGGTIDKLEGIKGFRAEIEAEEFYAQLNSVKIAIISHTKNICPADKILYGLRDITATIDSIPLIVASIMSKKLAGGAKNIVLDVKCGKGAFMPTLKDAKKLAKEMVGIGKAAGRNVTAIISNMDIPLSNYIGNSLEVYGAIEVLEGRKNNLYHISKILACNLLKSIGKENPEKLVDDAIKSGRALSVFKAMIEKQGGDIKSLTKENLLCSPFIYNVYTDECGFVTDIDALGLAKVVALFGGGREKLDDSIDHRVGIVLHKCVGEYVDDKAPIATMYYSKYEHFILCKDIIDAFKIEQVMTKKPKLIYARIN